MLEDWSDDDEEGVIFRWSDAPVKEEVVDLLDRYYRTVLRVIKRFDKDPVKIPTNYEISPIVVAKNVLPTILEEVPLLVKAYRVKCHVVDEILILTELSSQPQHEAACSSITRQLCNASIVEKGLLCCSRDNVQKFGSRYFLPDITIVTNKNTDIGTDQPTRRAVIEVEVSYRSVVQLRSDYALYLQDGAAHCLLLVKIFGTKTCPCQRAMAVLWVNSGGSINAVQAVEFGVSPMRNEQKRTLADEAKDTELPAVPLDMWERFSPLPADTFALSSPLTATEQREVTAWISKNGPTALYPLARPVLTLGKGLVLSERAGEGEGEGGDELSIDLGEVFYNICKCALRTTTSKSENKDEKHVTKERSNADGGPVPRMPAVTFELQEFEE